MRDPLAQAMAVDALPEVVFVGGPKDGLVCCLHAPLRDQVFMPTVTGIAAMPVWDLTSGEPVPLSQPMSVYQLAYTLGVPSLDDEGRYRYRYVGERQ